ncbi:hypothetical protein BU24DRAFT_426314 [Aaosphaeria arxii CBS 175.79]|uniref:Zn(2)-C6 fungal-type domain-containing protein n=1 Tax=Aaosphaeria arxii CBS 175.79 TaxID=1450172 RepID=A0A6A5XED0_9PLEO|nr:uncharacterized protein BU24DRAFT_426314 [Aaosphaeria arxii CBS 175.79]KAF2011231.1 hypothetical protein BU24DRAFT_426314 [Aaosphaeria arxii CBS 175.79]
MSHNNNNGNNNNSASPQSSRPPQQGQQGQHTRTYQACIPCRRRKVRCDLGPVDNPHDPPCVRCRRESKECFFSATRRKRKPQDDVDDVEDEQDDYEIRNARKRMRAPDHDEPHRPHPVNINRSNSYSAQPLTPGGSVGRHEPLRRPHSSSVPRDTEEDQKLSNTSTAILQAGEIYSGHDALNLLFEAAGRNGDFNHHRTNSTSSHNRPTLNAGSTPGSQTAFASPQAAAQPQNIRDTPVQSRPVPDLNVDPAISQQFNVMPEVPNDDPAFADAVRAWSRFRFVRAGWLTAKEAIAYIDYFYRYLSPLTPIVVPDYREYTLHGRLLKEEPMLTITLLTISSRFHQPATPGAISRSYLIHEKFWKYLQGMIDRMIYGQEQFGGGFCGAGQQPGSDVNPLSRKGLRTLGTVESLMLLTEWHPRALHFPPGDDDDELLLPDDLGDSSYADGAASKADLRQGPGGQRIDSWLEPCWRSDRMCWMLLGNAMSLAFEIGVFDDTSEAEFEEANSHLSHATVKAYYRRKNHLKDLLIIYVTQTSGRLGLTSMLPKVEREDDFTKKATPNEQYQERVTRIKAPAPNLGNRPDGQRLPLESIATQHRHAVQDLVLDFWGEIAKIMELGNLRLFPNRRQTRELLMSENYVELLQRFQEPLMRWKQNFDRAREVPDQLRHVLLIEFEYTRVYVNSLALQAVVERCTHNTPLQAHAQPHGSAASKDTSRDGGAIPFNTLQKWYGNDRHYINEVIEASRNVLRVVVEGLQQQNFLRHAPVRTFFRIVSVAIILLKTFALGATEDDVAYSLTLLDRAVEALRTSLVDDVHVGNRFADLVETLTHRIRARFVRLAANGSTGVSRAGSRSPTRVTAPIPMMPPPQPIPQQQQQNNNAQLNQPYPIPYQQGTGTSVPGSPSLGVTSSGRLTPTASHALWGISSESYDPNTNSISIMPPPGFAAPNGFYDSSTSSLNQPHDPNHQQQWNGTGTGAQGQAYAGNAGGFAGDQDWLALPLDPLLNQWGADITQTAMGPDVGGMDMLDILLNMGGPPGSA